jgi:hypothetical protein
MSERREAREGFEWRGLDERTIGSLRLIEEVGDARRMIA